MNDPQIYSAIGDDGLYMTKLRVRLHRIFNFTLVWGVISLLATLGFAIAAYMQGQVYTSLDLIATGGAQYHGYATADLLRIEAGFCFVTGVLIIATHLLGFVWLYEQSRMRALIILSSVVGALAIVWTIFLITIGLVDPFSLIDLILYLVMWLTIREVIRERNAVDLSV